ncbi:MAG TPA: hypothetical protein VGP33_16245 [Chloroflexota bacterium]|jgi:hypothetical protein|nr:hypothetical protein [Chloroflexota bacterium]
MPAILDRPPEAPAQTETQADPTRPWWRRRMPFALPRTRNAAPTGDDELVIDNQTKEAWRLCLGYRDLGALAAHTQIQVHVVKSGMLTARQVAAPAGTGYLTTYLNPSVHTVQIRHSLINNEPFYDLRLLEGQRKAAQKQS